MRIPRIVPSLLALWLGATACTGIDVKTDFDPEADFSSFKTFAIGGLSDENKGGVFDNSLTRKRIESPVRLELTNKGLQHVGLDQDPDLVVYYRVSVQEKQRVETVDPAPAPYGWRGGGYGRGPYGAGYGTTVTYEYKEGTLILDLVEPTKKELVWRATLVAFLEDTTEENVEIANKAIAKAFERYPPTKPVK